MSAAMDEQIDEYVPIGERCHRGCRRRASIAEGDSRYCARCFLGMMRIVNSTLPSPLAGVASLRPSVGSHD